MEIINIIIHMTYISILIKRLGGIQWINAVFITAQLVKAELARAPA